MVDTAQRKWDGRTDGLPWMHRSLIAILRVVDIRILYFVVDIVIIFYLIFSHKAYLSSYHYFRNRHDKKPLSAFWNVYLNFRQFGQVVIDRFAVYAGNHFDFDIEGNEHVYQAMDDGKGCVMLSSHVGNYEMAGYFLRPTRRMYALMFGGEKGVIMENKKKMLAGNGISVICQDDDWNYLYSINDVLQSGDMLTLLADRNLGSSKTLQVDVLGAPTKLPYGPFAIAKMHKNAHILCVYVMKEGATKYHIYVEQLSGQTAQQFAQQFAQKLSQILEKYPNQWYNLYEFWE